MRESPYILIAAKIERSSYLALRKRVKAAQLTNSKFIRDLVNRELTEPVINDNVDMDSALKDQQAR